MKRMFSVVLTLVLLLSLFGGVGGTVSAVEAPVNMIRSLEEEEYPTVGRCGPNATWEYDAKTATLRISGYGPMTDYGIEIWPASVDPDVEEAVRSSHRFQRTDETKTFTTGELAPWYQYWHYVYIETVIIEEGITSIGSGAFFECFALREVEIPESVTSIGDDAFNGCHDLEEVTIPQAVKKIGKEAFLGCGALKDIYIPEAVESIGIGAFASCYGVKAIRIHENNAYYSVDEKGILFDKSKTKLVQCPAGFRGDYVVPNGVTEICSDAFYRCELDSITFPDGLKKIGSEAFAWTSIYGNVVIPVSVESIEFRAFYNSDISSMAIWNPDCEIDQEALYFISVVFGYPGSQAEAGAYLSTFVGHLPLNGICYICGSAIGDAGPCGDDACWELVNEETGWTLYISGTGAMWGACDFEIYNGLIRHVVISEGITEVGGFWRCRELVSVQLPSTLTAFGFYAFGECVSLEEIVIPEGIKTIPDFCFTECTKLQKVNIPEGVTEIGESAFSDCVALKDIQLPAGVQTIGEYAFAECDTLTEIAIGAEVVQIGQRAFMGCDKLEKFTVYEENTVYSSGEQGILCDAQGTTLLCWPGGLGGEVTIPSQVKVIGESAFAFCNGLTSVHIPPTVEKVCEDAFRNSSVQKLIYEPNYTEVPEYCFALCFNLKEIELSDTVTTIRNDAFFSCPNLKEYTLGENVSYVEESGFDFCDALERVTVLNPNCYLGRYSLGCQDKTVIRGYIGSTAEEYAKKNDHFFEALPEEQRPEPEYTIEDFYDCDAKWYQEGVDFMLRRGYMNGVGKDKFAPNNTLNRAMVVTVLHRVSGSPDYDYPQYFEDVQDGLWYSKPVAWAAYYEIVNGMTPTTFAPEKDITREQIATILWRYAGEPKGDGDLSIFADKAEISEYAVEAMSWAVSVGILQGTGNGELNPTASATRAQFACMVQRYLSAE